MRVALDVNTDCPAQLVLWQLSEPALFYADGLTLDAVEQASLARISHPEKQRQWLASRYALRQVLSDGLPAWLRKSESGRPYLQDHSHHISLSHVAGYAAAIASSTHQVGIDLELIRLRSSYAVRRMFMNPRELAVYEQHEELLCFLLIWSTKEAVYKIFHQYREGLSFKLEIDSGVMPDTHRRLVGSYTAQVRLPKQHISLPVYYHILDEAILTYAAHPGL